MAVFEYRGLVAASGKEVKGVRDADNVKVLRSVLKRDGVMLTLANESKTSESSSERSTLFQGADQSDVAMMTRQLATLVRAGIPLVEAVSAMVEQVEKADLKRALTQVRDALNEGSSFAKALEAHPKLFEGLYVSMAAAGEASGTLEVVLERLSDFLESQAKLRGKVSAALAYPALMSIIGFGLVSLMMTTVVPQVSKIYDNLNKELPWYTQALIGTSKVVSSTQTLGAVLTVVAFNLVRRAVVVRQSAPKVKKQGEVYGAGWLIASGFAVAIWIIALVQVEDMLAYAIGSVGGLGAGFLISRGFKYLETAKGLLWRDTLLLRLPIFGNLIRMLAISRFTRTLSTLLKSGVPLLNAMGIVKAVLGNLRLEQIIDEASGQIREGESIAAPLKRSKEFPPMVTHMIAVGEKSGELEGMLENAARAYDVQVENRVQALTAMLEPLMMVLMGGIVGFIAVAILMPMVDMNDVSAIGGGEGP
jgi:general secretion pathway protein F